MLFSFLIFPGYTIEINGQIWGRGDKVYDEKLRRSEVPLSSAKNIGSILHYDNIDGTDLEHVFRFGIESPALVFVTEYVTGAYTNGDRNNAGEQIDIYFEGNHCASDRSFEGESSSITFHANAVCITRASVGINEARVLSMPKNTKNSALRAVIVALRTE